MTDIEFDAAVVTAVLAEAGLRGWRGTSLVEAVRDAGLDLARVRKRFPTKLTVLARFGTIADEAALSDVPSVGAVKDRLFDMIMRRFDVHQAHRAGVLAVLDAAALDPVLGLFLGGMASRSMGWLLEGAGLSGSGLRGGLRAQGLLGVWLWSVRAWREDESADLSATMTALDKALDRAGQLAHYIGDDPPVTEDDAAASAPLTPQAPPIDPVI
ncbi:TetR family transcriptional regulator [Acidisoma sp.]|uniref:TetR family transcriptional regulator n=1 Tax=Acidisoma sp. TaxID=1872115 RepID=UPI003AFFB429